jgi:hypothetical protein
MGAILSLLTEQLLPAILPELIKLIKKREQDPEFKAHIDAWADQAHAATNAKEEQDALAKLREIRARS